MFIFYNAFFWYFYLKVIFYYAFFWHSCLKVIVYNAFFWHFCLKVIVYNAFFWHFCLKVIVVFTQNGWQSILFNLLQLIKRSAFLVCVRLQRWFFSLDDINIA